ncbi:MAG TPA: sigma-70 family RNA polymerase sigma factor [Bryobacteraceae bacterium]|nr:sigma-70 family RNA polymerase sigma factor [Bryobacteraceae bacterium]
MGIGAGGISEGGDVTQLLHSWIGGDPKALDALMPLIYTELRRIADSYLRRERGGHTLQPTALVHEAWLRMVKQDHGAFTSRKHFYGVAAHLMRQILVDHARAARAEKRGGGAVLVDPAAGDAACAPLSKVEDFLALDRAMDALARVNPRQAQVLELKYFGGLTGEEIGELLGVSAATISRDQRTAEAWLSHAMSE